MRFATFDKYKKEALDSFGRYCTNNGWAFSERGQSAANDYFRVAYEIYKNVFKLNLEFILLGDTAIRKQRNTLLNFGVISATKKAQEASGTRLLNRVQRMRKKIAEPPMTNPVKNPMFRDPGQPRGTLNPMFVACEGPTCVWKHGSVLSTIKWSPLLNDTMMLAGGERQLDFIYALTDEEMVKLRAADANTDNVLEKWKAYFVANGESIWRGGIPRVFARELLTLQYLRYKVQIESDQLSFHLPEKNSIFVPTLEKLNMALLKAGYYAPQGDSAGKKKVLSKISSFLFDDADVLKDI